MDRAKLLVYNYTKACVEVDTSPTIFGLDDVYIVWFCKTLQHWKALVSTSLPDGMYYEVTYNGDKRVIYLDAYAKMQNVEYPDVVEDSDIVFAVNPRYNRPPGAA